jgi:hypothetical protein
VSTSTSSDCAFAAALNRDTTSQPLLPRRASTWVTLGWPE